MLPKQGPPCGWLVAYVETLTACHHMSLRSIFFQLPVEAGLALLEGRAARLNPKGSGGYIDRAIWQARDACRAELERTHTIIP